MDRLKQKDEKYIENCEKIRKHRKRPEDLEIAEKSIVEARLEN